MLETLEQVERLTGQVPKLAICDLGYRGKTMEGTSGSTRKRLRRLLPRRQVLEATIGPMKSRHRLDRNRLGKELGDTLHVLWAATGNNVSVRLKRLCAQAHAWSESYLSGTWAWLTMRIDCATEPMATGYAA